jgi:hypothetical protein
MLGHVYCQPRLLGMSAIATGMFPIVFPAVGQWFSTEALRAVSKSFSPLTDDPVLVLHLGLPINPTDDSQRIASYELPLSTLLDQTLKPILI